MAVYGLLAHSTVVFLLEVFLFEVMRPNLAQLQQKQYTEAIPMRLILLSRNHPGKNHQF